MGYWEGEVRARRTAGGMTGFGGPVRRRSPSFVRGRDKVSTPLTKCRTSAVDCGRLQAADQQAALREDCGNLGDVGQRRAREDCDRLGREAGGDPGEWVTHAAIHVELRAAA